MKFPKPYKLQTIAEMIGCTYVGTPDFSVLGINEIHRVEPGDIVFVDHPKYYQKALDSAATIILINKEVDCPEEKALLISDDPFRDFNKLTKFFKPFEPLHDAISESSYIGERTIIQPHVTIGNHVKIGENCIIHSNVVIYDHTQIGDNVIIHSGTVLGADAFYFKKRDTYFDPLLSSGNVVVEDGVTIGALCTIDRGVSGSTTIGKGTKIDNQVHIGHDTKIGEMCLIAAQVGIAGCVNIENNVTIWGQVGVASGITIGQNAVVFAQSGVTKSIDGDHQYFGTPAQEARDFYKQMVKLKKLS